jgi:hypothetical protein
VEEEAAEVGSMGRACVNDRANGHMVALSSRGQPVGDTGALSIGPPPRTGAPGSSWLNLIEPQDSVSTFRDIPSSW